MLVSLAVGGCAGEPARERSTLLVAAISSDPGHINPAITTQGGVRTAAGLLLEGLLALDEDALTRVARLRLLADLQTRIGVAYVLVAHDLHLVRRVADRIAVMRGGRFVEVGTADDIYARARHPYTRELMAASLGSQGGVEPG